MDLSKMGKETKIGYFNINGPSINLLEFNPRYLTNKDGDEYKFIQIKIYGNDYIRIGDIYHRMILRETLNEFGIKFETKINKIGNDIPLDKCDNYKLVGAGRIKFFENKLKFYDFSSDYIDYVMGADGNNLEAIFSKENVKKIEGRPGFPSFLVDF